MRAKSDENTPSQLHNESISKSSPMEVDNDDDEMPQQLDNEAARKMSIKSSSTSNSRSISPMPALSPAFIINEPIEATSSEGFGNENGNDVVLNDVGLEEEDEEMEEDVKPKVTKKEKKKPEVIKKKKKKVEAIRIFDKNAPKQVKSAYLFFMQDRRSSASNSNKTAQELLSEIAAEWKNLTDEERKPFELLSAEDKKRKDQEMKEYMKTKEYADFQKKKAKLAAEQGRKRKRGDSDDESAVNQVFPSTSTFCPLLNDTPSASSSSSSKNIQFSGPIFNPQFITYNKARDSYRRQMQIERSGLEKELEALHDHDPEIRLKNQKDEIKEVDKKLASIMRTMNTVLEGVNVAQSHLSDIESLTEWLETVSTLSATHSTRKAVREAASKFGNKSIKK